VGSIDNELKDITV